MTVMNRFDVVSGLPSVLRLALSVVGVVGAASIALAVAFAVATSPDTSPWMVPLLLVAMLLYWAPAVFWASWWVSVPAFLLSGTAVAVLTHRYRRAHPSSSRRRRLVRICVVVAFVCGIWALGVGALMVLALAAAG